MHPHVSLSNKCGMRPCSRVTRLKLSFVCPYLFLRPMFMSDFCYVDALHLTAKREFHAKHFYLDRHCKRVDRIFLSTILSLSIHD